MIMSLVEQTIYWTKSFTLKNGVSYLISPGTIFEVRLKIDMSKDNISFGAYAMVYAKTTD